LRDEVGYKFTVNYNDLNNDFTKSINFKKLNYCLKSLQIDLITIEMWKFFYYRLPQGANSLNQLQILCLTVAEIHMFK
jgi:hypothetical protein